MKGYSKYFWFILFIGDLFLINLSFVLSYYFKFNSFDFSDQYRFLLIIFNSVWILVAFVLNLYQLKRLRRLDRVLYNLFKNLLFNTFIISAILFSLKASEFSREHLYITYLMLFTLILLWRYIAIKLIYLYRKSGYNYKRVLIIGGGEVSDQLYKYVNSEDVLGGRLEGIFTDQSLMFETKTT